MNISIIIPTINESEYIGRLIERLLTSDNQKIELIIVDGGSQDETISIAETHPIKILQCKCSRAAQMNMGAKAAKYDILYFIHADTLPPIGYFDDAEHFFSLGYDAVCFKSKFESKKPLLRVNEFFTRFYWLVSRGGDQSLFIRKETFLQLGQYDESKVVMEEYPLLEKLMKLKKLAIIPKPILISTRKYEERSWLKVSRANYAAFKLYQKGTDSKVIKQRYLEILG